MFINNTASLPQEKKNNKQLDLGIELKEIMRTTVKYSNSA